MAALSIDDRSYASAPWMIAVPVREGSFVASRASLQPFNVVTDVGEVQPFGAVRENPPEDDLLWCDLQTTTELHRPGRLGSGRSGCYQGRYLKGIGRTPLAANWSRARDQKVGTGHLAVSAAIREYVVSCYVRAKGYDTIINGCEGLLLAPLDDGLKDFGAYGYPDIDAVAPCDASMQAISVKGSRFARFSNFAWLMNHLDVYTSGDDLRSLFLRFVAYLDPSTAVAPAEVTPTRIARSFSAAIDRAIENFRVFFRLGIFFGSPFNNFTMDGRYHDLDTVLFLGGPYLGILPVEEMSEMPMRGTNPSSIFGMEVLTYVLYVRLFYRGFLARLTALAETDVPFGPNEQAFVRATVAALQAEIGPDHLLLSTERLAELVVSWLRDDAGLEGSPLARAREMTTYACHARMTPRAMHDVLDVPLRQVPLRAARPGTFRRYAPPHIVDFCDVSADAVAEAQFMHDVLHRLDSIGDLDELLVEVDAAAASISRECTAPPL